MPTHGRTRSPRGENQIHPKNGFSIQSVKERQQQQKSHQNRTSHGTSKDRFPRHVSIFLPFLLCPRWLRFVQSSSHRTRDDSFVPPPNDSTRLVQPSSRAQNTCRTTRWVPGSRKGAKTTVQKCAELNALATTVKDAHPPPYHTPSGCHYLKTPFIIPFYISVCHPYLLATKSQL